ncbi:hypothetical protein ACJX0J_028631, partial [Zea mays]
LKCFGEEQIRRTTLVLGFHFMFIQIIYMHDNIYYFRVFRVVPSTAEIEYSTIGEQIRSYAPVDIMNDLGLIFIWVLSIEKIIESLTVGDGKMDIEHQHNTKGFGFIVITSTLTFVEL